MSNETTVEQVNVDIDALFGADADSVTLPETNTKSVFKAPEENVDMSFTEDKTKDETETVAEITEEATEETKEEATSPQIEAQAQEVFDSLEVDEEEEQPTQKKRNQR